MSFVHSESRPVDHSGPPKWREQTRQKAPDKPSEKSTALRTVRRATATLHAVRGFVRCPELKAATCIICAYYRSAAAVSRSRRRIRNRWMIRFAALISSDLQWVLEAPIRLLLLRRYCPMRCALRGKQTMFGTIFVKPDLAFARLVHQRFPVSGGNPEEGAQARNRRMGQAKLLRPAHPCRRSCGPEQDVCTIRAIVITTRHHPDDT